jgi:hypothetical protein
VRRRINQILAVTDRTGLTYGEIDRAITSARRFVERSRQAESEANPGDISAGL